MSYYGGKRVLITGGSSGIGKATARLMVRGGAHVVIAARGEQRLNQAVDEVRRAGRGSCEGLVLDIADGEAVRAAASEVIDKLGGLDILLNNAGVVHPGYVQNIPDDVFETMMQVNYFGTVRVTRAFLPHFVAQRSGQICNVSSLLGYLGVFGYSAYAASKFAICGFSDCLRQELLPYGVNVSVVFPPDTDTPQLHEENRIKPPETKAVAGNVKILSADEVARAIAEGIEAGRYHIVPGLSNKFAYFMHRHFPWMVRYVIDNDLKRYQSGGRGAKSPQA